MKPIYITHQLLLDCPFLSLQFLWIFFCFSKKKQQSNTKLSFLLAINKQLDIHFQNAKKNKWTKNSDVECLPSLFFLMKLWLFLCCIPGQGDGCSATRAPHLDVWPWRIHRFVTRTRSALSSLKAGPAPQPLPAFRSIKTEGLSVTLTAACF